MYDLCMTWGGGGVKHTFLSTYYVYFVSSDLNFIAKSKRNIILAIYNTK